MEKIAEDSTTDGKLLLTTKTNTMIHSIYYPVLLTDGEYHHINFTAEYSHEDNGLDDTTSYERIGRVEWDDKLFSIADNNEIRKEAESKAVRDAFEENIETGKDFFEI